MKKALFFLAIAFTLSFTASEPTEVWMCNNGKTEVYHINKNCSAMKRCTNPKVKLTLSEAKKKGLRLCGYED